MATNQCDGCQAGKDTIFSRAGTQEIRMHRMGAPGEYPDYMVCQAEKYQHEAASGDPRQEVKE